MSVEGKWNVRYSAQQDATFVNEDGDPEEVGKVELNDGRVSGNDPWGAKYEGTYKLEDSQIMAEVEVSSTEIDHPFIFEGVPNPFNLKLNGEYNSPDYLSMRGVVVGFPEFKIVLNCSRIKE